MRYVVFCLVLIGCSPLSIDRRYVDRDSLPSTKIKSPDPRQFNPPEGEKLYVHWRIPEQIDLEDLILTLRVIKKDLEKETKTMKINARSGLYIYSLMGEDYERSGGILTYEADIGPITGAPLFEKKGILFFEPVQIWKDGNEVLKQAPLSS